MRRTRASDIRQTYADILGRVDAIALVHDTLYATDELSRVSVGQYLGRLCDSIQQLRRDKDRVKLRVHAQDASIGLDQAVTLGLITTELVTNALKHAFPGNRSGDVTVTFACEDRNCVLVVADNGIGLASVDEKAGFQSGLRLVSSMVLQLGATVTEDMQDGTRFELRFPQK
jgi:two-component sensor histidine kinase